MMTNVKNEVDSVMAMQRGVQPLITHRDNLDLVNRDEQDRESSKLPYNNNDPDTSGTLTDPDENWLVDQNAQQMLTSMGQTELES